MRPVLLSLVLLSFAATAKDWSVDPVGSKLEFSGTYQGETFSGMFSKFTARIAYDPADLATAKFDVTIDVASARTGNGDYDAQLKTSDFFDPTKFPPAHFVTSGFRSRGADVFAEGTLTIRDKSKPITLMVNFVNTEDGATLDVTTTLKRLDFDIGTGDWKDVDLIANDVPITAHLVLKSGD